MIDDEEVQHRVRERAHQIWLDSGKPGGCAGRYAHAGEGNAAGGSGDQGRISVTSRGLDRLRPVSAR